MLAICKPEKEEEARNAGAEYVGGNDMIQKIQSEGWMDFDVVVTTPDMMGMVGRLGKVLGPRGLMPNPKAGTVTPDIARAITEAKAGKIEYRLDKTNIIHCPIGKVSFGAEKLLANFTTLLDAINKAKPAALWPPRWAPASRSTRTRSADPFSEKSLDRLSLSCYNN